MVLTAADRARGVRQPRPVQLPGGDGDRHLQGLAGGAVLHAREVQSRLTKLVVLTGLFFLVILLGETMMDYATRGLQGLLPQLH